MLKKRIIPCLDIKDGRTVKGVNFKKIRDMGDPVEIAKRYSFEGADELVFLDIMASEENRVATLKMVQSVAREINIPFTVGGGISDLESAGKIIASGADKISVNSAAVRNPELISELADAYGNQCIVLAIDVKNIENDWIVYTNGGKISTGRKLLDWAREGISLGAGEILLTSIDHDGTGKGFAIDILKELADNVNVPVIASGGGGTIAHFEEVFTKTRVTGALAASVFHSAQIKIQELKEGLIQENIAIRC